MGNATVGRIRPWIGLLGIALVVASPAKGSMTVLVTNDDGVSAPGIDQMVAELAKNSELEVVVFAPERDQSGTGDNRVLPPGVISVRSTTTASGFPAKAVTLFPADSVLFGVLEDRADDPPALIVSGINSGPNMGAELVGLSGTVGAATWGARLGVPAIAVSASFSSPDYPGAARFVAAIVERFRTSQGFQNKMREADPPFRGVVLNINWPTCTTGTGLRGAQVVAVGRLLRPTGYSPLLPEPLADLGGLQLWQGLGDLPDLDTLGQLQDSDCTSTVTSPATDLEAWGNGLVGIAPLDAERSASGRAPGDFAFLESLF